MPPRVGANLRGAWCSPTSCSLLPLCTSCECPCLPPSQTLSLMSDDTGTPDLTSSPAIPQPDFHKASRSSHFANSRWHAQDTSPCSPSDSSDFLGSPPGCTASSLPRRSALCTGAAGKATLHWWLCNRAITTLLQARAALWRLLLPAHPLPGLAPSRMGGIYTWVVCSSPVAA